MWTLPNIITLVRICFTPVIALLPFIEGYWPKLIAFIIFIIAAVSDVYDGHLARSRNEVTDLGKLLDPIADKLLLFATLIPIYFISRWRHDLYDIPIWGSIPLWVCLLLIGRELAMTSFPLVGQQERGGDPCRRRRQVEDHDPECFRRRRYPLVCLPRCAQAHGLGAQSIRAILERIPRRLCRRHAGCCGSAHRLLLCALSLPQPATLLRPHLAGPSRVVRCEY